jgi:hypothetical protein
MIAKLSVIAGDLRQHKWSRRYYKRYFRIPPLTDTGILIYLPLTILVSSNNSNKLPAHLVIIV